MRRQLLCDKKLFLNRLFDGTNFFSFGIKYFYRKLWKFVLHIELNDNVSCCYAHKKTSEVIGNEIKEMYFKCSGFFTENAQDN